MSLQDRENQSSPLRAYLLANLIAWAAFVILFVLVGLVAGDWSGTGGYFLIFAAAFAVASAFDYLYDRWIVASAQRPAACDTPSSVAPDPTNRSEKRRRSRRR